MTTTESTASRQAQPQEETLEPVEALKVELEVDELEAGLENEPEEENEGDPEEELDAVLVVRDKDVRSYTDGQLFIILKNPVYTDEEAKRAEQEIIRREQVFLDARPERDAIRAESKRLEGLGMIPHNSNLELTVEDMIEGLYNLSQNDLRQLAHEALLISDGPQRVFEGPPDMSCLLAAELTCPETQPKLRKRLFEYQKAIHEDTLGEHWRQVSKGEL